MSYAPRYPLAERFCKNGFVYRLILRCPVAMVYEQIRPIDSRFGFTVGYEVHIKKLRKERKINSIQLPKQIRRPSNEDFGKWAWSFAGENADSRAHTKFHQIRDQYKLGTRIKDFKYKRPNNSSKKR